MCRMDIMRLNQKQKRGVVMFLLTLFLLCQGSPGIRAGQAPIVYSQSGVAGVSRNACELRRCWDAISAPTARFAAVPSVRAPYSPGKLSDSMLAQALAYVNFIRYAAGLPAVTAPEKDNLAAQYGAMLLAASNTLSHTPSCPADMPRPVYQTGLQALSQSNISYLQFSTGTSGARDKLERTMPLSIQGYMNAQGRSNRAHVAHRRWILNPNLTTIGIGCADANAGSEYQVLKILDATSGASCPDYQFIAWPASGVFPSQAINPKNPWSITLNPKQFKIPSRRDLTITITREDGKCWTLNGKSSSDSGREEFLLVNTERYGVPNCIIFAFAAGQADKLSGSYHVTVSGLTTTGGAAAILDYTTTFAEIENAAHVWGDFVPTVPATCTKGGWAVRQCAECGCTEKKELEPLGHCWEQTVLLQASQKYVAGKAEFACTRCGAHKLDTLPLTPCDPAACPCAHFTDLPPASHWAHNGIDFVIENNIFTGINANTFSPKGTMTRAMMITVLWRMAGKPECTDAVAFSDVAAGQYYSEAVAWGVSTGIVSGISPSCFAPANTVTREQAITFLYRLYGSERAVNTEVSLSDFADSEALHSYARTPALWAVQNEILNGNTRQCLCPRDSLTREQAVAIIMRCMQ